MEKLTYSFYTKGIDPTDQHPHEPTKYFWVRKFMTVEATEEQKKDMIRVLSDIEHPLYKLVHHAFTEIKLNPAMNGEKFDDPFYAMLETDGNTPYIRATVKGDGEKGDSLII